MAVYTQTNTFVNGTTADGGQVNTEIVNLGQSVNNIVNAQVSASAAIAISKTTLGTFSDWAAWTPSWTNLTVGNGTVVARYTQIGKFVYFHLRITFGTTTSVSGTVSFSTPTTMGTAYTGANPLAQARLVDNSPANTYEGIAVYSTNTTMIPAVITAGGTYAQVAAVDGSTPITWTTSDAMLITGHYESV